MARAAAQQQRYWHGAASAGSASAGVVGLYAWIQDIDALLLTPTQLRVLLLVTEPLLETLHGVEFVAGTAMGR